MQASHANAACLTAWIDYTGFVPRHRDAFDVICREKKFPHVLLCTLRYFFLWLLLIASFYVLFKHKHGVFDGKTWWHGHPCLIYAMLSTLSVEVITPHSTSFSSVARLTARIDGLSDGDLCLRLFLHKLIASFYVLFKHKHGVFDGKTWWHGHPCPDTALIYLSKVKTIWE